MEGGVDGAGEEAVGDADGARRRRRPQRRCGTRATATVGRCRRAQGGPLAGPPGQARTAVTPLASSRRAAAKS
uniref:Uncharacterized protein n=1 Tax=Arundo donax TaxID=35708 RepID=A0A0A9Q1G9_ARUDO